MEQYLFFSEAIFLLHIKKILVGPMALTPSHVHPQVSLSLYPNISLNLS